MVRRKLETGRIGQVLARRGRGLEETLAGLRARTDANRTRLEPMRQQAEVMAEEAPRRRNEDQRLAPDLGVGAEEVEIALLRERQRRARP